MRFSLYAGGLLAAVLFAPVVGPVAVLAATSPETTLPQPVADWIAQARQDCPAGFSNHGAVQTVDLTGDGKPGFVADPHRLACAGSPHLYGGQGPASIELFVTAPAGNVVHTGGVLALGYRIEPGGASQPPSIIFETHDVKDEAGSFDTYRWDGHNFAMLSHSSMAVPPTE